VELDDHRVAAFRAARGAADRVFGLQEQAQLFAVFGVLVRARRAQRLSDEQLALQRRAGQRRPRRLG
jgi:hypothetical protein